MSKFVLPGETHKAQAKAQCGALLPNIDPMIGEIVLSTMLANPNAPIAECYAALIVQAPEAIVVEITNACLELLFCKEKGALYWMENPVQDILVGVRPIPANKSIAVGPTQWPLAALLDGPPKSVVIRMTDGVRRVWMACADLKGAIVRQSEAIALGNAMVESFGGRIIEDRTGPEVMAQSFIEDNMTARAKRRAVALSFTERMVVTPEFKGTRADHERLAMAEAMPGTCEVGMGLHPEDKPERMYEVERRISEDWVLLVATMPGPSERVPYPDAWQLADGRPPAAGLEDPWWGFTEGVEDGVAVSP